MSADHSPIWPYVIAVLTILIVYRRLRRSFGRQPVRPVRMQIRIAILTVLGISLLPLVLKSSDFLLAEAAGFAGGIALGVWGAQRTRFATAGGQKFYIPHTYSGIAISLLLIGRLAYRLMQFYSLQRRAGESPFPADAFSSQDMVKSPLTVALLCAVVGYYLCFYGYVLWKSKRISPEDVEASATSPAAPP